MLNHQVIHLSQDVQVMNNFKSHSHYANHRTDLYALRMTNDNDNDFESRRYSTWY